MVVVYTGMANAMRSRLVAEQGSLIQLGKSSCRLLYTGSASVPPKCQPCNLSECSMPLMRVSTLISGFI